MKQIKVSATKARNKFFDLLDLVAYKNYQVIIQKNKQDFVKIVPEASPEEKLFTVNDVVDKTYGMIATDGEFPYEKPEVKKKERKENKSWQK